MRKHVANAIDWYVNKVNEAHLLPVNLATLVRDISAKQIGGEGFSPRPLTAANFTDPELDAIRELVEKASGGRTVTYKTYYKGLGIPQRIAGKRVSDYLSPLNSVRTTLGQFAVSGSGDERRVKDTYDFNREGKWKLFDHGDGTFSLRNWKYDGQPVRMAKKDVEDLLSGRSGGSYGTIRQNAANFGHIDEDPDSEKIKVDIPMSDIMKRLGDNAGKFDIKAPVTDDEFKWRSAGAGVSAGAPVGALLGLLSGGIRLFGKKARRNWIRTIISHMLGGAAIGAATGGIGSWIAAGNALEKFNSNKMNEKSGEAKVKRSNWKKNQRLRERVIEMLSYAIPVAVLSGAGAYGASRLYSLRDRMLNPDQDIYSMKNERVEFVDDISKI